MLWVSPQQQQGGVALINITILEPHPVPKYPAPPANDVTGGKRLLTHPTLICWGRGSCGGRRGGGTSLPWGRLRGGFCLWFRWALGIGLGFRFDAASLSQPEMLSSAFFVYESPTFWTTDVGCQVTKM